MAINGPKIKIHSYFWKVQLSSTLYRPCLIAVLALSGLFQASAQAKAPKPSFPEQIEMTPAKSQLVKMGEYRYVYGFVFTLYDVALYATPGSDPDDVRSARTSFRLQFRYLRKIEQSIILESSAKMLDKNLNTEQRKQIAERVNRLNEAYRTVRDGDRSSLSFVPGKGTTLRINGKSVVTIEGEDFAQLYFQIWLGDQPISKSLREQLLGT